MSFKASYDLFLDLKARLINYISNLDLALIIFMFGRDYNRLKN